MSEIPYPLLKRVTDVSVAGALSVALAPVLAAVGAAMGLDMLIRPRDRGPFLYRERRISRGREFELLKFRTLRTDVLAQMRAQGGHARLYEADPANLTWAGRHLLKPWYLDELPQLANILRGEMSLVGPRPWPPSMVRDQIAAGKDYRLGIRAGWTGPAQVQKGAPEPTAYETVDLDYVERCRSSSPLRLVRYDLGVLRETVRVLRRGEGLRF
jgi:lipopolysaccharide/colanic/teichoic acid biosynthesis glycosyltransferase